MVPTRDDDWPSLHSILAFQNRARERLRKVYSDIAEGKISLTRKVARVLFMTFEHEGLHVEVTLAIGKLVDVLSLLQDALVHATSASRDRNDSSTRLFSSSLGVSRSAVANSTQTCCSNR